MLQHTPQGFESFKPTMEKLFNDNYPEILKNIGEYKKDEGKTVRCPIWSWNCKFDVRGGTSLEGSCCIWSP